MGEIAANTAAFQAEFGKALSLLPSAAVGAEGHEEGLRHVRAVRGIQQVIVHYAARLPHSVAIPMMLEYGDVLMARSEYRLCLDAIYSYLLDLDIMAASFDEQPLSGCQRVEYQARTVYGLTLCASAFLLVEDPEVQHPDTLADLVDIMGRMRGAIGLALAEASLYWLAFNGTLHLFRLATRLSTLGFSKQALEPLIYATLALEVHPEYGLPSYLPWRLQLTAAVCNAYADLGVPAKAAAFVSRVREKIAALQALFKLDPVPMSEEQVAAFADAFRVLATLAFKYEAPLLEGAEPLASRLGSDFGVPQHRLLALAESLQSPTRRTAKHALPGEAEGRLLAAAAEILNQRLPIFTRVISGRAVLREERAADAAEAEERGVSLEELHAERATTSAEAEAKAAEEAERAAKEAAAKKPAKKGGKDAKGGKGAAPVCEEPALPEKYEDTPEMCAAFDAAVAEVPIQLAHKMTELAFNYEQWELFSQLAACTALRTSRDGDAPERLDVAGVAEVLSALRAMEESLTDETQRKLVATVDQWFDHCVGISPDLLTDVAMLMWSQTREALEGADTLADQDSDLAQTVLFCIHKVFQAVNADDPQLRLVVALRLGGLLEQGGLLHDAAVVLRDAARVSTAFRYAALTKTRGEKDEFMRWISGSASQPSDDATSYTKRMEESEQALACLHADVTLRLFRVELGIGLLEQDELTVRRVSKVTKEITVADRNAQSFGGHTTAAITKDASRLARAGEQTSHPARKERELLAAVGKNPYERALLLMAAAPMHAERHQQERMLKEAAESLMAAQQMEDALFENAKKRSKERRTAPLPPKVLCRSPTSVTLTTPRLHLASNRKPATYKVYGKPFGVGVSMAMNATSTEYNGLGKPLAIGERVTVDGLKPNDTYIFSVAAFDSKDRVIGELGESTPEIPMLLPLPLYLCWSYLCLAASSLGCAPVARLAGSTVMSHFVVRTPDRPLWEAHPADAEVLNRKHAERAAWPLLRSTVHVMFLWVAKLAAPALVMPPRDQRTLYLEDQVVRLRAARRLGSALQIAGMLLDNGLIMEGAVRMYNLLAPLLALKDKSPFLVKSLLTCYTVVQSASQEISLRQAGTKEMRYAAARATSAMLYELVGLSTKHVAPWAESDVAVQLAKLDCELLRVFEAELKEGGADVGRAYELRELQDVLLRHPALPQFAGPDSDGAIGARLAAPGEDAHAAILPMLDNQPPEAVWTKLQELKDAEGYWEMASRLMETAAKGGTPLPQLKEWAATILAELKARTRVPADDVAFGRWNLAEAAEAVAVPDGTVSLSDEDVAQLTERIYGAADAPEGLEPVEGQRLEAELAAAKAERLTEFVQERQRQTAAASLLQQRLLPLLRRRRKVKAANKLLCQAGLWTSRTHALLGTLIAAQCRQERHKRLERDALREKLGLEKGDEEGDAAAGSAAPPPSEDKKKAADKGGGKGGKKGEAAPPLAESTGPALPPQVEALRHLSRGIELAARGGHWHQVQSIASDLWNVGRQLVNHHPELIAEVPRVTWIQKPYEAPPPTAAAAAGGKKDAKKGGKPAPAAAAPPPGAGAKMVWATEGGSPNVPRFLRIALLRCLELLSRVRDGLPIYARLVAEEGLSALDAKRQKAEERRRAAADGERPSSAMTLATESGFSIGSDRVPVQWFAAQDDVDMEFYAGLALMALNVLQHARRFNALFALGAEFNRVSDEFFAERVLPYLMVAAPTCGADMAQLQLALERVVRDKNQALDELHKVRGAVRDRLASVPLLATSPERKAKKKAGSAFKGNAGRLRALEQMSTTSRKRGDGQTEGSAVTGLTARTSRTKASTKADNIALPEQYAKVIKTLKERQEKVLQVQAMNELGDVHAHFGAWPEAVQLWNDTLDTIVGPFQVIRCWRPHLAQYSKPEMLAHYGLPWVLLAGGVLLGKLVRFGYAHQMGTQLEAARMSAELLSCAFTASVTHPQRLVGFATYTPVEIWETVNPLADPFAAPLPDLLAGCDAVASCLLDAGLALQALPVLALYEHLALHAARDVGETLHCRQLRVAACCQLGLLAEASRILLPLMAGRSLPDPSSAQRELVVLDAATGAKLEVEVPEQPMDPKLPASHEANRPIVNFISEAELPPELRDLYGKFIVCRLRIRRAQWLSAVGGTPNQWKLTDPRSGQEVPAEQQLEAVEPSCLEQAATLLKSVTAEAKTDYDAALKAELTGASMPPAADKKKDAGKDAKGVKSSKSMGKQSAKAIGKDVAPTGGEQEDTGAGLMDPPEDGYAMTPTDHEAIAQAQLALAGVQRAQWQDRAAMLTLQRVVEYIAKFADPTHGMAPTNDAIERTLLGPRLWMAARKAICETYLYLGHTAHVHRMAAVIKGEAAQVKDVWCLLAVQGYDTAAYAIEGATAKAVQGYQALLGTYTKLGLADTVPAAKVMMEYAALLDRMGYRKSSAAVDANALQAMRDVTHQMGLREAQEHPELVNLYAIGTPLLVEAIMRASKHRLRERDYKAARDLAKEALETAPYGRTLPGLHAAAAAHLARCERHMLLPPPADPYKATVPEMRSARACLAQSLAVGLLDGGHAHAGMRTALLEAAALLLANRELGGANEILQTAHRMALCLQKLRHATHTVDGVSVTNVPKWASELVATREAFLTSTRGSALPSDRSMPDVETGRVLLLELVNLRRRPGIGSLDVCERQVAMAAELHRVLRAECPKYATECCLPAVPVLRPGVQPPGEDAGEAAAAAPAPAAEAKGGKKGAAAPAGAAAGPQPLVPGLVVVQWHEQDGCWQDNESWYTEGQLGEGDVCNEVLLAAEPAPAYVAMLYVAVPAGDRGSAPLDEYEAAEGAADFGDKAFPLGAVRGMARRVKDLRVRADEGGAEGQPLMSAREPPSSEELVELMRELGSFLRQDIVDEEAVDENYGRPPSALPGGTASLLDTAPVADGAPEAVPAPEELPAYMAAGPELLPKLEALLNVEDGLFVVDAQLADWLRSVFHPN